MTLSRDLILNLKRQHEEGLRHINQLIDSPVLRTIREQQERMRAFVESPTARMIRDRSERMKGLIDPPMLRVWREQDALVKNAVSSLAIHPIIDEGQPVKRLVQELAGSFEKANGLAPLALANEALSRSVLRPDFIEAIRAISSEYQANSLTLSATVSEVAQRFKEIDQRSSVRLFTETFRSLEASGLYDGFKHIEEISRAAERVLGTVRWNSLGDLIGVRNLTALQGGTYRLNRSYAGLTASVAAAPESVIDAPFIATLPPLSVYAHARALRSITSHRDDEPTVHVWDEVQEETTIVIESLLPRVNKALLKSWKGGWATARRREADWVRQAAVSFRHVLITALDTIAPKSKVLADGVDRRHLTPKGEPTRLGQVHWLCRSIRSQAYRKMVFSDLESALTIIDAMSEAVHRDDYPEIEQAFDHMSVRTALALRHLLELFNARN